MTKNNPKIIAYIRVSTDKQDFNNQKLILLEYSRNNNIKINEFVEAEVSSKKSTKERLIDKLLTQLKPYDTLLITELSRLGRSVGQVIQIVDELIQKNIRLISLKENIHINEKEKDISTTVMITMFSLFAEIERKLISQRTKEGIAGARAKGKKLGRPVSYTFSKLDPYRDEIMALLAVASSKRYIANKYQVSQKTLYNWLQKNNRAG